MTAGRAPTSDGQAGLSRRTAIRIIAVGAFGAAVGVGGTALVARLNRAAPRRYFFLSEDEAAPLIALCEQIIPRDDAPGAADTGVVDYIDRQLAGPLARHQQSYRTGLGALRGTCLRHFQLSFEELAFDRQTALVRLLESGGAPSDSWGAQAQQSFFSLVLDHTRQGFYGSPRHGGNRDYASYRMLGLAYPNLIGQNRYAGGRGA